MHSKVQEARTNGQGKQKELINVFVLSSVVRKNRGGVGVSSDYSIFNHFT